MKRYEQGSIGMRHDLNGHWCSYADALKAVLAERIRCAEVLEESVVRLSACPSSPENDASVSALKEHALRIRNRLADAS